MIDGSIYSCLIWENRGIVFALVMIEKLKGIETALFYRCSMTVGFFFSEHRHLLDSLKHRLRPLDLTY